MEFRLKVNAENPFLESKNNIVINANEGFIRLSGFSEDEIIGKSITEISKMLRIDSKASLDNYCNEVDCYMFNKEYEPKYINIVCKILGSKEERIYYFNEESSLPIDKQNNYIEQIYKDNKMGVGIYSFPDFILLKANQKYLNCADYPYNLKENSLGNNINNIMSTFDKLNEQKSINYKLKMGQSCYENIVKFDYLNGVEKCLEISLVPMCKDGKTNLIITTIIDVSEKVINRKLLEEKIKVINEQKNELQAIIENMYDYLLIFDKDGNIKKINQSAKNHIFYSGEICKIKGYLKHIEVFDENGNLVSQASMLNCILMGQIISGAKYTLKIDDSITHIEVNGRPIYDEKGNFSSGILLVHDITEKVKSQENLLLKNQYVVIKTVMENLKFGFVRVTYPDFNIKYINNRTYVELLKYNPNVTLASVIGKNVFDVFNYKMDRDTELESHISKLNNKNFNTTHYYRKYISGDKEKYVKILCQPLFGLKNVVTEIMFIAIDMTEEITEKNKMEKTLKIQDEIFANISHELKTPLNVIFSTNQLMELYLQNNSVEENKEDFYKSIKMIKQNCYRFTKLINNIVDISKIDSGFLNINLSNKNIVSTVEDIVQSVSEYVKAKNISIIFDTNVEEKIIACDPDKIERIILNLISNAIKFTNKNGSIFVNIIDEGKNVVIEVRDTGIGIERKYIDNIFKRFHQVDKSLSRNAEGSGIGLSLVKSIVELHGGNISVNSKVGEGSKFRIVLPVKLVDNLKVIEKNNPNSNKIEMINIEFSDIYSIE